MQQKGNREAYDHILNVLTDPHVVDRIERERTELCHFPSGRSADLFAFIGQYMDGCEHVHYHHEGDVWVHTKMVIKNIISAEHDYIDVAAGLLHDIGKKAALAANNGKNMHGHELLGLPLAEKVLESFAFEKEEIHQVMWLVHMHTAANDLIRSKSKYSCWKLVSHPWFYRLRRLVVADSKSTIGADGLPTTDYDKEFEASLAGWCSKHCMPSPIVSWEDLEEIPPEDRFEVYKLCHKIQINSNINKRYSILNNATASYKQRKKHEMSARNSLSGVRDSQ